jgi:hypothetical protein
MTREQLFTTTFEPQFELATSFHSLVRKQTAAPAKRATGEARSITPSDYPGYEIIPGDAIYTSYDSLGHPVTGIQRFTLRVIFAFSQLAIDTMRTTRSDYVSGIEAFFSGGYTPPAPLPGDPARIDSVQILKIEPAIYDKTATRAVIGVEAEYYFTLF